MAGGNGFQRKKEEEAKEAFNKREKDKSEAAAMAFSGPRSER